MSVPGYPLPPFQGTVSAKIIELRRWLELISRRLGVETQPFCRICWSWHWPWERHIQKTPSE